MLSNYAFIVGIQSGYLKSELQNDKILDYFFVLQLFDWFTAPLNTSLSKISITSHI